MTPETPNLQTRTHEENRVLNDGLRPFRPYPGVPFWYQGNSCRSPVLSPLVAPSPTTGHDHTRSIVRLLILSVWPNASSGLPIISSSVPAHEGAGNSGDSTPTVLLQPTRSTRRHLEHAFRRAQAGPFVFLPGAVKRRGRIAADPLSPDFEPSPIQAITLLLSPHTHNAWDLMRAHHQTQCAFATALELNPTASAV